MEYETPIAYIGYTWILRLSELHVWNVELKLGLADNYTMMSAARAFCPAYD